MESLIKNGASETFEQVTLSDGTPVTLRPIRPDDAARLQAFHTRLSDESIFFRFLGHPRRLSDEQARALTNVDYTNTMALVAALPAQNDVRLVGVARYEVISSAQPKRAEAAIIVEDQAQRLGLGAILAERLVTYARQRGIQHFLAVIDSGNVSVLRLLQRCGLPFQVVGRDADAMEIRIDLA